MTVLVTASELEDWLDIPFTADKVAIAEDVCLAVDDYIGRICTVPAPVPDDLKVAARMLAARLYKRHLTPEGIATFGGVDGMAVMRVGTVDPDVAMLLAPFRVWTGFA